MDNIYPPLRLLFNTPFFVAKAALLRHFRRARPLLTGLVLDVGCGRKPFRKYLRSERYYGMEYRTENGPDFCGDALDIPVGSGIVDSVICAEVLEHVKDPKGAIREISRVLKTDGTLYLTAPMLWYHHYEPHDYFRFTKYGLAHMLKDDFEIIWISRYGGLNYFIANRVSESIYGALMKATMVTMLRGIARQRLCLILLAPVQALLYAYASIADKFNKRDAAGFALLARKRAPAGTPAPSSTSA